MSEAVIDPNKGAAADPNANGGAGADQDLDLDLDLEDDGGGDDGGKDKGDQGKKGKFADETPEARSSRLARMSDQHDKKHGLGKYAKDNTNNRASETGNLDYGQEAYLIANGIKESEEMDLVKSVMKSSGKDLRTVLEDGYFQHQLKGLRDTRASRQAIPDGSRRAGNQSSNTVEYWIAKGELPPPEMVQLRRDVVNAKLKAKTETNVFSSNPVIGG